MWCEFGLSDYVEYLQGLKGQGSGLLGSGEIGKSCGVVMRQVAMIISGGN